MSGVIAAGSEVTAQAGAEMLARKGNAIDAIVAAALATAAGEPTLTSLAGGGIILLRDGGSGEPYLIDCFGNAPGLGGSEDVEKDFFPVDLNFGPAIQTFYVGRASCGVPGVLPGLLALHGQWGKLPFSEVIQPACGFLRNGSTFGEYQTSAMNLLAPILKLEAESHDLFRHQPNSDDLLVPGDVFRNTDLANTLEAMAKEDPMVFYKEEICKRILKSFGEQQGGLITQKDLDAYEVQIREPMRVHYKDARLYCNPPPAAGGEMIACMLSMLEYAKIHEHPAQSLGRAKILANAMKVADHFRALGNTYYNAKNLKKWKGAFDEFMTTNLSASPTITDGRGHTTHISVIDEESNAVGMTFSHGEGNGYLIPDTGIMMNNLMGEEDLHPEGWFKIPPGERLSTMMCPTLLHRPQKALIMMGTGGANRIRTAIVQTINLLMDHELSAQKAINAPRLHFEGGVLNAEIHGSLGAADYGQLKPEKFVPFEQPSLFFGGVHMVMAQNQEELLGAGDARRNGTCLKVNAKGQIKAL